MTRVEMTQVWSDVPLHEERLRTTNKKGHDREEPGPAPSSRLSDTKGRHWTTWFRLHFFERRGPRSLAALPCVVWCWCEMGPVRIGAAAVREVARARVLQQQH